MNAFTQSISQVFKGAIKAVKTFPATIICAFMFTIVTMIKIQMDWPQQETYDFLFNCLHWAFAVGTIFSLTAITGVKSQFDKGRAFLIANLFGALVVLLTFLALYFFGKSETTVSPASVISEMAAARTAVVILVSFLAFIILAGYPKDQSDIARSLFMIQKAFFIALIYGIVIMAGTSGVAGSIQALLYREMSEKVYMYIAALAGFLAFTIFVGYFPDFRKGQMDERRMIAQKQPRFVEVLFSYILIPIVLALTAVLLLWAGKTIFSGAVSTFTTLASIAAWYTIGGIWLYIMVTHHETGLAKLYRRIYPIAALVILAFEAWAFVIQLNKSGLKTEEYFFLLIWILAVTAAILLIILKWKAYRTIIILVCALAVFSVLPALSYKALPVTAQVTRLEKILVSHGMLQDNKLIPASAEPEQTVREKITDSVYYLANVQDAKLPVWFDKDLRESNVFETKLGFKQTWPKDPVTSPTEQKATSLTLPNEAIDIRGYQWAVQMQNYESMKDNTLITINGSKGIYTIIWSVNTSDGIPTLTIKQDNRVILEQTMKAYLDRVATAFPPGRADFSRVTIEDMSLQLNTSEVAVYLVFGNININKDSQLDTVSYWLNLNVLYMKEK